MTDLFALRSGGRTGFHPTVDSLEMRVAEKIALRSSELLLLLLLLLLKKIDNAKPGEGD